MQKAFVSIGALMGLLGVAFGAFGAHMLAKRFDARETELWATAGRYQLVHALAIVLVAALFERYAGRILSASGVFFILGTVIFCGTLYAMALGAPRWFGAITPLGGISMMLGWLLLALTPWLAKVVER